MTSFRDTAQAQAQTLASRLRGSALMLMLVAVAGAADVAHAKTPGRSYCFLGRCHRVLTLAETRSRLGRTEILRASFYDDCARDRFNPCALTSSGEAFRPLSPDNAASPIYPDGTMLLLFYPVTGAAAVVRVNNAGPYHSTRLIDVSVATADALGFREKGLADLEVRVIAAPRADEAIYRRLRRYWPVHGPIGRHGAILEAHQALVQVSELPRVPARPDAAQLVTLPMTAVTATPAAAEQVIALADPPAPTSGNPPPPDAIARIPILPEDQQLIAEAPREFVAVYAAGFIASVPLSAATDGSDFVRAREAAIPTGGAGLLVTLRAKARHRLTPGRLSDIGLDATMTWVRDAAATLAANARAAARARIKPHVTAKLASLDRAEAPPDSFSRR